MAYASISAAEPCQFLAGLDAGETEALRARHESIQKEVDRICGMMSAKVLAEAVGRRLLFSTVDRAQYLLAVTTMGNALRYEESAAEWFEIYGSDTFSAFCYSVDTDEERVARFSKSKATSLPLMIVY